MLDARSLLLAPNLLSLLRLLLGPIILVIFVPGDQAIVLLCLAIMAVAEITDLADGWAARRFNQVSDLGKLLDPMSDSIYRFCVFLALFGAGWMDAWMICAVFVRDVVVAYTRVFSAIQGIVLAARPSGKAKAVVQGVAQFGAMAMIAAMPAVGEIVARGVAEALLLAATLVTIFSAIDYVVGASRDAARSGSGR